MKKFRLILEDESSLQQRINFTASPLLWLLIITGVVIIAGIISIFILASTPLKTYLPGYLKESERTATEQEHLRLDSLVHVYEINEAYITGILNSLHPSEELQDDKMDKQVTPLSLDSLIPPSEVELLFIEQLREREKYNINVASQAAAQNLMFGNVNNGAIITEETKDKYQADFILPVDAPISAVAEGIVISMASSPKTSGGYEIIIQHPKGFLSKSSRLSNLLVKPGDRVAAGQIIATGTVRTGMKDNHMIFELWHDGEPLIPAQYIK